MNLLVFALIILLASGAIALVANRRPHLATAVGTAGTVLACTLGMVPVGQTLLGHHWTWSPWTAS